MLVYILVIKRSIGTIPYTRVKSAFDSEEKAWADIEQEFSRFSKIILEMNYQIRACAFSKNGLYLSYESDNMDSEGYIIWDILARPIL